MFFGMIDQATIDRIFATANIVEVIGDFVSLKRKGVNYQACCPFHNEKTPSFVVSPSKGLFKCFGCGKGGNAVTFVMEHEHMTYPEALKYVARKYNIEVAEREITPEEQRHNDDRESMMVVSSYAADLFRPHAARKPPKDKTSDWPIFGNGDSPTPPSANSDWATAPGEATPSPVRPWPTDTRNNFWSRRG